MIEIAALGESRAVPTVAANELTKNASTTDFQATLKQVGEEAERAASSVNSSSLSTEQEKPETVQETKEKNQELPLLQGGELAPMALPPLFTAPALPVATVAQESATNDEIQQVQQNGMQALPLTSSSLPTPMEPNAVPQEANADTANTPLVQDAKLETKPEPGQDTAVAVPTASEALPESQDSPDKDSTVIKEMKGKGDPNTATNATQGPDALLAGAPEASTPVKQGASPEASITLRSPLRPHELPEQIAHFVQRAGESGQTELHVRLDPPALGNISVVLEHGKAGVTVRIVAQTQETLLLLQGQRNPLHEELSRQNIQLESFSASLAGDTGGQRPNARHFSTPVRLPLSEGVAMIERPATVLHQLYRLGGLDARA